MRKHDFPRNNAGIANNKKKAKLPSYGNKTQKLKSGKKLKFNNKANNPTDIKIIAKYPNKNEGTGLFKNNIKPNEISGAVFFNTINSKPKKALNASDSFECRPSFSSCFACDLNCSISKSGYSPMNYSPYQRKVRRRSYTPS